MAGCFKILKEPYGGTFNFYNSHYQVSRHFQSFLGEEFAEQVEWIRRQRVSLYNITPLPFLIFLSPLGSVLFNTLIHVQFADQYFARQSKAVMICIHLVQLTRSNTFYQSINQAHHSSSMSKFNFNIILSISPQLGIKMSRLRSSYKYLNLSSCSKTSSEENQMPAGTSLSELRFTEYI